MCWIRVCVLFLYSIVYQAATTRFVGCILLPGNEPPRPSMYWNRELSVGNTNALDASAPLLRSARIISVSDVLDPANDALHSLYATSPSSNDNSYNNNKESIQVVAIGGNGGIQDFDMDALRKLEPNVIFVSHPTQGKEILNLLVQSIPSIQWIHFRSAGLDSFLSSSLLTYLQTSAKTQIQMTNAKGVFSSTLAEYTMMAIAYFAKDLPRLMKQKHDKLWNKYPVLEIRKATLGIVGYGDIGKAAARLAKAYGMRVIALQREKKALDNANEVNEVMYMDQGLTNSLYPLLHQSDYILISLPLTDQTRRLIDAVAFSHVKQGSVIINVGRGPIIDEDAMIHELRPGGKLKGAALDVFTVEPLDSMSELWTMDNVLLSPHNMDKTATFMHESTEFFLMENVPRFLRKQPLLNPVNPWIGY